MPDRLGAYASEGEGPNKIYAEEQIMDQSGRDSMANSSKIAGYNSEMTKDEERSPQMKMNPTLVKNKSANK